MRSAAARAATRRGLSRITVPPHHDSDNSAGATAVVLPAPGGATNTAFGTAFRALPAPRSTASSSGSTAWIGSGLTATP